MLSALAKYLLEIVLMIDTRYTSTPTPSDIYKLVSVFFFLEIINILADCVDRKVLQNERHTLDSSQINFDLEIIGSFLAIYHDTIFRIDIEIRSLQTSTN